jgi:phosphatidate cytidylyltransferase
MKIELKKRIITSFFLLSLLSLMYFYTYILLVALIIIAVISWFEFYGMISKIFKKKSYKDRFLKILFKSSSLLYILVLVFIILIIESKTPEFKIFIFYSVLVSVSSDIGGLIVGKTFKGKKLTKISPNKTISGSIGSFILSLLLVPLFMNHLINHNFLTLSLITFFVSFTSQMGDLFISYLKRKAKIKDTSNLLPGHGGLLDRIDGIIFAVPIGLLLLINF